MNKYLFEYIYQGSRNVYGWLYKPAIDIITSIANTQEALGINGPVCEIGIHHGKSFILIHLLTQDNEMSVAYDLFERQQENLDKSGLGDKASSSIT